MRNEVCNDIAFVKSGILRVFFINDDEEITLEFVFPDSFTTAFGYNKEHNVSSWNFQAIVDCEILLIDKELHRNVITSNVNSFDFYEKQLSQAYSQKERKLLSLLNLKAEERFENLFKTQPEIFNQIPLKFIASSLGITPETLSRLRKRFVSSIS